MSGPFPSVTGMAAPSAAESLDAGILLACRLSSKSAARGQDRVDPLTSVAGLPLLVRSVLALQRAGIRELVIVTDEPDRAARALGRYPRAAVPVRWVTLPDGALEQPGYWEALLAVTRRPVLIAEATVVLTPALVPAVNRLLTQRALGLRLLPATGGGGGDEARHSSPAVPVRLLIVPAAVPSTHPATPSMSDGVDHRPATTLPTALLAVVAPTGPLPAVTLSPALCHTVDRRAEIRESERRLLRALHDGKVFEGWVDAHLNRRLSPVLSRLFLHLDLSPNTITALSTGLGLLGAGCFATGQYGASVVGGLLLQLSAIVDCCDGEVARVTFAESPLGAQLDLAADNLVHAAIFGAIAWGLFLHPTWSMSLLPMLPLLLGGLVIAGNGFSLAFVLRAKRLRERGRLNGPEQVRRVDLVLKKLASRDFSVVVIACAVLGWLDWFLWAAALGANVFWVLLAWLTRPSTLRVARLPSEG